MKTTTFKEMALVLLALSLVFVFGCSEKLSITEASDQTTSSVAQSVTAEPNWIKMPKLVSKSLIKGTGFKVTKMVKANKTTKMRIKDSYNGTNGKVKVDINIEFKKHTVAEDTEITMTFDIKTGVITFSPHMIFNKNAGLEVVLEGMPLEIIESADLNFLYLAPDGKYEAIDKHFIKVKIDKGKVTLKHGKIPHFSRYGFCK